MPVDNMHNGGRRVHADNAAASTSRRSKARSDRHAKGLSPDALVREVLNGILADASEIPDRALFEPATGVLLVAAMQASPYKEYKEMDRT